MKEISYLTYDEPDADGMKYELLEDYEYKSRLFRRTKTLKKGMKSDGATKAIDVGANLKQSFKVQIILWCIRRALSLFLKYVWPTKVTDGWWIHDGFCIDPYWDDGYPITNFVASMVLCTILYFDGYKLEAYTWFLPTFFSGGKLIKEKNGWIWLKEGADDRAPI